MPAADISQLLDAHRDGDPRAIEMLMPLIYGDLRLIAHRQLARGRPGASLNTTALVHEAYIKLVEAKRLQVDDRRHFFALTARAMRQVIVDVARSRAAKKRGGDKIKISLDRVQLGTGAQAELMLVLDNALTRLSEINERWTRVFECRYFVGMDSHETAETLGLSLRMVQRDYVKSKAWLRSELAGGG